MSVFSEFEVDGEVRDIYDKAAVHEEEFPEAFADELEDSIDASVITLYRSLGAEFE